MKTKIDIDKCTGCRACEQACPKKCINIKEDEEGFIYPHIDKSLCINCDICVKSCHIDKDKTNSETSCGYYGWHKDEKIRNASSSGGAFSAIIEQFKEKDPIIYGAAYNEKSDYVSHQRATYSDYTKFRKSKYVFCDPADSYSSAKKDLKEGKYVIFSGTPCQIAGLKTYLNKDYEKLLTIDFICHGVPSIKVYNKHIEYISENSLVKEVDFRVRELGWRVAGIKVVTENKNYVKSISNDYYVYSFLNDYTLRKCCYNCQDSINHSADITLADFWGIAEVRPELYNCPGASLIICNTKKGKQYAQNLENNMHIENLDYKYYKYAYITHSHYIIDRRREFFSSLKNKKYSKLVRKFIVKQKIKSINARSKRGIKKLVKVMGFKKA